MRITLKSWFGRAVGAVLLVLIVLPVAVYVLLRFGWPPVIGNLTAAHELKSYAAEVHPKWKAEGTWAVYNLVDGGYHLRFEAGGEEKSLACQNGVVWDEERERAVRGELNIDRALRQVNAMDGWTYWGIRWRVDDPEQAVITVRTDFYDDGQAPIPDEAAIREKMADRGMAVYGSMAQYSAIHRFTVGYCHPAIKGEHNGNYWYKITVELPQGRELTREDILAGEIDH